MLAEASQARPGCGYGREADSLANDSPHVRLRTYTVTESFFGRRIALAAATAVTACGRGEPGKSTLRLETVSGGATTVVDFERVVDSVMRKAGVSGLSVAILNDSAVVYTRQFGWTDKDAGTTPNDTTRFAAASLSKTVFGYLVLVLAEEGVIDLDKPLEEYLPRPLTEYPRYADLASDARYRKITPRMALSHTAGFPNRRSFTGGRLGISFEPGSRFSYSGEGIDLLQFVVEQITKIDLEALAQEKVFRPFGMTHTSFVWNDGFASNIAAQHNEWQWASDPDRPGTAGAAGSMITTAGDYARFLVGILAARERRAQTVDRMLAPVVRITSARMFGPSAETTTAANDGIALSWGLGWGLFDTPNGRAFFTRGTRAVPRITRSRTAIVESESCCSATATISNRSRGRSSPRESATAHLPSTGWDTSPTIRRRESRRRRAPRPCSYRPTSWRGTPANIGGSRATCPRISRPIAATCTRRTTARRGTGSGLGRRACSSSEAGP